LASLLAQAADFAEAHLIQNIVDNAAFTDDTERAIREVREGLSFAR
jgi:hypothetical protein